MNETAICQAIADKLTDDVQLSEGERGHAAACPVCRAVQARLAGLRGKGTLLPPPPPGLAQKIRDRLGQSGSGPVPVPVAVSVSDPGSALSPPAPSPTPSPAAPSVPAAALLPRWRPAPAWGALLLVVVAAAAGLWWPRPPAVVSPGAPEAGFELVRPGQAAVWAAFGSPLDLPAGETTARLPDGITLRFTGVRHPVLQAQICAITEGTVAAEVPPGRTGFRVDTPHGNVEVTGTIFRVTVRPDRAEVQVTRGSVRITPLGGSPRPLVAGESADMLPWPAKPNSASGAAFTPPAIDTDVDGQGN